MGIEIMSTDYLTHNEILIKLNRYPLNEKFNITRMYSQMFIKEGLKLPDGNPHIYPWDLEIFLLFALFSTNKHTPNSFNSRQGIKEFSKIINSIKQSLEPDFDKLPPDEIVLKILALIGKQQFRLQEDNWGLNVYRYNFIFNCENTIKMKFENYFASSYLNIAKFCFFIHFLSRYGDNYNNAIMYVAQKNKNLFNLFVINLEELKERQLEFTPRPIDYKYGF